MLPQIQQEIEELLHKAGVAGEIALTTPPKPEMGDLAFACFGLSKELQKKPNEVALDLKSKIINHKSKIIDRVESFGPYVNFFLNPSAIAGLILSDIKKQGKKYGSHQVGKGKKYLVEFACPNPLKAFHIGHLKNLITGESVVRVFENAGYKVVRVNYQGDVGMHVAKALWGIMDWKDEFEKVSHASLNEKAEFLGRAYTHGATQFEKGEAEKAEVVKYNDIVYEASDKEVIKVYKQARKWSLEYFDEIYKRLGSHFDRFYFESEMFKRGTELVKHGLSKGIFKQGDGAIIFEGSKFGLHDRVFINSKGFPTYEAKDMALGERHFKDYHPDKVVHVVGKEQTEYFKVVFKALEFVLPESAGKEFHLIGGFLQLKGDQKMSSRKGNIVTGDELLEEVNERVAKVMAASTRDNKTKNPKVLQKVANAALKYGMLKNNVSQDVSFDLEESLSVSGDSGPYLLYVVARIISILGKVGKPSIKTTVPAAIAPEEKALLLKLADFEAVTLEAATSYDPSKIAKYLFTLAQSFTRFYEACPVLKAEADIKTFRVSIISAVLLVFQKGLDLLGIETVNEM